MLGLLVGTLVIVGLRTSAFAQLSGVPDAGGSSMRASTSGAGSSGSSRARRRAKPARRTYIADQPGGAILGLGSPPSPNAYQNRWSSTGFLVLDRPATVMVHASISYTSPYGATGHDADCYIADEDGHTIGNNTVYLRIAGSEDTGASFTSIGTLPAGTHNVQIWCCSYGTPALAITSAGLTAMAISQ
jgi:hypothetical protein